MIITCIKVFLTVFVELHATFYGVSEEVHGIMFILLWEIQRRGQRKEWKDGGGGNKHCKTEMRSKKESVAFKQAAGGYTSLVKPCT